MPPLPAPDGLPLRIEGLQMAAPDGRILMTVDALTVAPGTSVAVRGPSGAGKSTLLHGLAGLIRPAMGRVVWGDTDIAALGEDGRAAFRHDHIGLIFQDFLLFDELAAVENAALCAAFRPRAARPALRSQAARLLAGFGLAAATERAAASLSGGERQRVAIARALTNDPAILLADEPTASLDRATADRLIDVLADLGRTAGRTLIAVTHDAALIERMDRVITVIDGRIAGDTHG